MSGIIAVYALVIAVLIAGNLNPDSYSLFNGFMHLGCGLSVGGSGLAAGYAIGIVGDQGVRSYMQQSRIFVGMVLILIFGEVLGLYGYIYLTGSKHARMLTCSQIDCWSYYEYSRHSMNDQNVRFCTLRC
jgi:F0F1-type ATP synthase membrane subunit c/vacuolar-type H+-ATPase subunit K